ncbi:helicase, putative, partial [Ixodes scapularis]
VRSMLYNRSDVVADLEWVIFDECHYINDPDRGVVWEEVLIMLPRHVGLVLLSATVPNALNLANWIGRIKERMLYVICTTKRPVPLEHHLYFNQETFLILDASNKFQTSRCGCPDFKLFYITHVMLYPHPFNCVMHSVSSFNFEQDRSRYQGLIQHLRKADRLPVICFTLSRKRCDENALSLRSLDLTTAEEKSAIRRFIQSTVTSRLGRADQRLPQLRTLRSLLESGFGVHHSGVLPILKEAVEMLFQRGLVKVLFATETFAMGVNMPARTVVFDSIRKHDGVSNRDLLPAEYIQMAGRAGRRGKDKTGTVLIMCKAEVPESSQLQAMMLGRPTELQSRFRITYSMILNLKAQAHKRVEDMMRDSFRENSNQASKWGRVAWDSAHGCNGSHYFYGVLKGAQTSSPKKLFFSFTRYHCSKVKLLYSISYAFELLKSQLIKLEDSNRAFPRGLSAQRQGAPPLAPKQEGLDSGRDTGSPAADRALCRCAVHCFAHHQVGPQEAGVTSCFSQWRLISLSGHCGSFLVFSCPRHPQGKTLLGQELLEVVEAHPKGLPAINVPKDMRIQAMDSVDLVQRCQMLEEKLLSSDCLGCPLFETHFDQGRRRQRLTEELARMRHLLSEESLASMPDYQNHVLALEKLGYLEPEGALTLKGRVARALSSHEVMLTELLLQESLLTLGAPEVAALFSSFVFEQRTEDELVIPKSMAAAVHKFGEVAQRIGKVQRECGFDEPPDQFVEQFSFGLCNVVYHWAKGMHFAHIMELTKTQEGIIVRCIQRLDELLKDVRTAAGIVGNPELRAKMEEASRLIRRDIVFAASLYLQ